MASFNDSPLIFLMIPLEFFLVFVLIVVIAAGLSNILGMIAGILILLILGLGGFLRAKMVYDDASELGLSAGMWSLVSALVPIFGILLYISVRKESEERKKIEDERSRIDLNQYRDEIVAAELADGEGMSKRKTVKRPAINIDEHGQIKE